MVYWNHQTLLGVTNMPVSESDVVFVKSVTVDDTNLNGGEMAYLQIVDAVNSNIFPTISQAKRIAGSTGEWRKIFIKNKENTGLGLFNSKAYIENPTPAGDMVFLADGTLTNKQGDLNNPRLYGCGWLSSSVSAGVSSILVACEDGGVHIFAVGDTVRISDKVSVDSLVGNEEYVTISTVTYAGDIATIGFTPPLVNNYSATNQATRVASLLSCGTIQSSISTPVVTSAQGSYDHATYPIVADNRGSIRQNITLTFTSSTAFTLIGDTLGSLGSGNISGANCSPTNPNVAAPYFIINANGFLGSFVAGDSITFTVLPSAKGLWLKRIIPANTASRAGNKFILVVEGESE